MIGLLQRVTEAHVTVGGTTIGEISAGLMVLVGIERSDTEQEADRLLERLLTYRVFADEYGRMNLGLSTVGGGLLLVPQFTLVADTSKGLRPGFAAAASPDHAQQLFNYLCDQARACYHRVACGEFGTDMQVSLVNDGPVTFSLRVD